MQKKPNTDYNPSPLKLFVLIVASIISAELCITFVVQSLPAIPPQLAPFIHAFVLLIVTVPLLYLLFYQPMKRQFGKIKKNEEDSYYYGQVYPEEIIVRFRVKDE